MPPAAHRSPWIWVPTLYFAQGLPYAIIATVSGAMYKSLGVSNTELAFYTSLLTLPWTIKPLWSPFLELIGTKRSWILLMQSALALGFLAIAATLHRSAFFLLSVGVFLLMAFAAATDDIATDGFYLMGLDDREQAAFSGVRSTFFRAAMIAAQGGVVFLAGRLETTLGGEAHTAQAWSIAMGVLAVVFGILGLYHRAALPAPPTDFPGRHQGRDPIREFVTIFLEFFRKPRIKSTIAFLLLYRFAEAQMVKMVVPFLLDPREKGGLGLSTADLGIAYGTVGVGALVVGGILGGYLGARFGLKRMLWIMVCAIHLPDAVFVYLSQTQPLSFSTISVAIAVEQLGYGFGFTAYLLYMMRVAKGRHQTAHYALCTGIMSLGMMIPGAWSGALQTRVGYSHFFLWVMLATIPGFLVAATISVDQDSLPRQTG